MIKRLLTLFFLLLAFCTYAQTDVVWFCTNPDMNYTPNSDITYDIIITNNGPSPANVHVSNSLPGFNLTPGITRFAWTATTGASGNNMPINDNILVNAGQTVIYTVTIRIPGSFNGTLPQPQVTWGQNANIVVTNTNNQNYYTPGTTTTYTLTVKNNGPEIAEDVLVTNPVSPGITNVTWVGSNGTSGTGAISDLIASMYVNQVIIYTITVDIPATFTGPLVSNPGAVITGTQVDPTPGCNCSDTDYPLNTGADIVVVNTNGQAAYTPGTNSVYTVTVTNNGPEVATNVLVTNPIPSGITAFSWVGTNGSSGTNTALNNTIPTLAVGQTVTYTITLGVPASYNAQYLTSTASATSALYDPNPGCPQCSDQDYRSTAAANVVVVNTDGQATYINGQPNVYTVTVTNQGPNIATAVLVQFPVPPGIPASDMTWTGSNASSGTGTLFNTINTLTVNQTITYTVTINVPNDYVGDLRTEAIVTSYADPDPTCAQCVDIDTNDDPEADIVVTNTNGQDVYIAGAVTVYTVTVTNNGPSAAQNVVVNNPVPAGITGFTWTGSNGTSGNNVPLQDAIASLPAGQTITYTINLDVPASYTDANITSATSVTSDTLDPVPACPACVDVDYAVPSTDIRVTQTLNSGSVYTPGVIADYTITVTNMGPTDAQDVSVQGVIPAGITAAQVTWVGSNGTAGSGTVSDVIALLANGASVTYHVYIDVPASFGPATNLVNTVNVTSTTPDTTPNCPQCTRTATPAPKADIVTVKNNGQSTYNADETYTYTITVFNAGPSNAYNVVVNDPQPYHTESMTWMGNNAGGASSMSNTIPVLAAGQSVQYIVTYKVPEDYPEFVGDLINTVTVTSDTPDPNPLCPRCTDTDTPNGNFVTVVTNRYTPEEMVKDVLIGADCLITNFQSSTGTDLGSTANGIGYFNKNNSDFIFKEGVLLTAGDAVRLGGPNDTTIQGNNGFGGNPMGWNGDADLIPFQGTASSNWDATSIQFDFQPLKPSIEIDYLFSAEEYHYGGFECGFADVFAFILTDLTVSTPPINIAVLPNGQPVNIENIHVQTPSCTPANPTLFGQYNFTLAGMPASVPSINRNLSPININGQTVRLTASAPLDVTHIYRMKLVIANANDHVYNTAVFLESIDIGLPKLPGDLTFAEGTALCYEQDYTLAVDTQGANYTFEWKHNGQTVQDDSGQPVTTSSIVVSQPGTYTVVSTSVVDPDCVFTDDMVIEYNAPINAGVASNMNRCQNATGQYTFDLTQNTMPVLNGLDPSLYPLTYHLTMQDADVDNFFPLTDAEAQNFVLNGNGPQTIYIRVEDIVTQCHVVRPFDLVINNCAINPGQPDPILLCEAAPYDGFDTFDLTIRNNQILGSLNPADYTVTFYQSQTDADGGTAFINPPQTYLGTNELLYVRVQSNTIPEAFGFTTLQLYVVPKPQVDLLNDVTVCDSYTLPVLTEGNYYTQSNGLGTMLNANDAITTTQTIYIYKGNFGPGGGCVSEDEFTVTVVPSPVVDEPANVTTCNSYTLPALTVGNYYTQSGGLGTPLAANDVITTTQDIYVYATTATTPPCTDEHMFTVSIVSSPVLGTATPVEVCDDDTDGVAQFDLTNALAQIINGQTGLTATLHLSQADADNNANAQSLPFHTTASTTVYIRVVPTGASCYSVAPVQLIVNPKPVIPSIPSIELCDDNAPVGQEDFDLTTRLNDITGGDASLTVTFYATQADANGPGTPVANPSAYPSATGVVWVRVVDAKGCYNVSSFNLVVKPLPAINTSPADYGECESAPGESVFDLTTQDAQITGGNAGLQVRYYENLIDAQNYASNFISGPYTSPSRTLQVRVDDPATGCHAITELDIISIPLPVPGTPAPIELCDDNNDGFQYFDLTPAGTQAINGQPGLMATFHETLAGAQGPGTPIADPTNYHSVSDVIYIRIADVTGAGCAAVTQVQLTVNPRPVPVPIAPYEVCDDDTDGFAQFNLNSRSALITNSTPGQTVTYYASQADLTANNPIATPGAYTNTTASQQDIYFTVKNALNCTTDGSFQIVVNPLPVINTSLPTFYACEETPGQGSFELTEIDAVVTGGAAGYNVTYYDTLLKAQQGVTGTNLVSPYLSGPATIYVRVQDADTGCYAVTSQALDVIPAPVAATPAPLHECDDNNDGVVPFNIQAVLNQISSTMPNVSLTVHETAEDAEHGVNSIPAGQLPAYSNLDDGNDIVYIRVQSTLTACYDVVELELIVHPSPVATEPTEPYQVCDTNSDGLGVFNLNSYVSSILGTLSPTQHTVTFHNSLANANDGLNPITNVVSYTSAGGTVYIRVEENTTHCFDVVELELIVNPLPVANQPTPITLCDDNAPTGTESFDLTSKTDEITGGVDGVTLTFYHTYAQAEAGTAAGRINNTTAYINGATVETLFVRVTNDATGCYRIVLLDVRVEPLPVVTLPTPGDTSITECDPDGDGFATFDLEALKADLINNGVNLQVTFHETLENASTGNEPILNTTNYTNIDPDSQRIYVRVVNTATGCVNYGMGLSFELTVIAAPQIPDIDLDPLAKCDEDSNNQNGQTSVNLETRGDDIRAQLGTGYTIRYFTDEAFAIANTPRITNPTTYNGTDGQVIWVRIENAQGCYNITSFELEIGTPLLLTTPTPLSVCDSQPNDGRATFDLTSKENEILGPFGVGQGYTLTYYTRNAGGSGNPIANPANFTQIATPDAYTNTGSAAQTIYVVVTSAAPESCRSFTTLTIRVLPVPTPDTTPDALEVCDDDTDGQAIFNLKDAEADIRDNDNTTVITYYTSQADAEAGVPGTEIATPNNYLAASSTVYVRVEANTNNPADPKCYQVVELELIVNPLPVLGDPATGTIAPYAICEIPFDGVATFILNSHIPQILVGQNAADYTVKFYRDAAALAAGTAMPNQYTNTTSPNSQTILVQVKNNDTGCVSTGSLTLLVEPGAVANPVTNTTAYEVCDTDGTNDGVETFDLTPLAAQVLGSQNPAQFSVMYYESQAAAEAGVPGTEIANPAAYMNTFSPDLATIWIRVTNTSTVSGCHEVTSFDIQVERLPDPVITSEENSDTLCFEFNAATPLNSLTLHAGVTGAGYSYQWQRNGTDLPGATAEALTVTQEGDYTVVVTSPAPFSCVSDVSPVFEVIKSGPAQAIGTGYTVSNAFSELQTITINVQGHGTYEYRVDNGPWQASNIFTDVTPGEHTVTVRDTRTANPCDDLVIGGVSIIDYPRYFTPNGDGYHDRWNIIGLGSQGDAKIYIFDRYGKLIKQISSGGAGWDGTMNNYPLPADDYWFTVTYKEEVNGQLVDKEFKSHFALKR